MIELYLRNVSAVKTYNNLFCPAPHRLHLLFSTTISALDKNKHPSDHMQPEWPVQRMCFATLSQSANRMVLTLSHIWNNSARHSGSGCPSTPTYSDGLEGTSVIEGVGQAESEFGLEGKESQSQINVPTPLLPVVWQVGRLYLFNLMSPNLAEPKHQFDTAFQARTPLLTSHTNHPSHVSYLRHFLCKHSQLI